MLDFLLYLLFGIVGAWLVNYLADVLPVHRRFVALRCPDCQAERKWQGYLLYARCKSCGRAQSRRRLVLLFVIPILSLLGGNYPVDALGSAGTILWLAYFTLIVVIDLEHRLILHPVSLVGAGLALVFGWRAHGMSATLLGGAAGFGIMLIFYYLGEAFVKILSRRRGEQIEEVALGFGDVNLAGILGLLLGWPGVIGGLFLAVILGGVFSGFVLVYQLLRKDYQAYQALPYGPFLAISVMLLFYLSQVVR